MTIHSAKTIRTYLIRACHKIAPLVCGCSCWYLLSSMYPYQLWLNVPIAFYATPEHITIQAPEHIAIKLSAARAHMQALDREHLALHINARTLHEGDNEIAINQENLFLPKNIRLIDYQPSYIRVSVRTTEKQETSAS